MCLILLANEVHPTYKYIIIANRDEFYHRPSLPIHFWEEHPYLLAGKDLEAGGTWMGISKEGKLAAITNFRDPRQIKTQAPSRGELPLHYLKGQWEPLKYLMRMQFRATQYNGFNIILGDQEDLFYFSNQERIIKKIDAGIHGLSNHLLNTPWQKIEKGKQKLKDYLLSSETLEVEAFFEILEDRSLAPDHLLPQTGVPLEWERILSAMFIKSENYGTCASSVLLWSYNNEITFAERLHNSSDPKAHTQVLRFQLD